LDIELNDDVNDDSDKEIKEFIQKATLTQNYIKEINNLADRLGMIRTDLNTAVGSKQKELSSQIEEIIKKFSDPQNRTNFLIPKLQEIMKKSKTDDPEGLNPETRIEINLSGSIIKEFEEAIGKFQSRQSDIQATMRNSTVRDAETLLNKKLNDKEKQDIIDNPEV